MCCPMFPFILPIKSGFLSCSLLRQVTSESLSKGTDSLTAHENNNPGYEWHSWFVILTNMLQNSENFQEQLDRFGSFFFKNSLPLCCKWESAAVAQNMAKSMRTGIRILFFTLSSHYPSALWFSWLSAFSFLWFLDDSCSFSGFLPL